MSEDELRRLVGLIEEKVADQLTIFGENLDSLVGKRVKPLEEKVDKLIVAQETVSKALGETNKELRNLDKAVGDVELKLHDTKTLAFDAYVRSARHEKAIAKLQTKAA